MIANMLHVDAALHTTRLLAHGLPRTEQGTANAIEILLVDIQEFLDGLPGADQLWQQSTPERAAGTRKRDRKGSRKAVAK